MIDAAIVIQARMGSQRLPGKTMMSLAGHRMLYHVVARLEIADISGPLIIATSNSPTDDFICSFSGSSGVQCYRGSEDDVLSRYWEAVEDLDVTYVVRATADNPLVYEGAVAHLGSLIVELGCDYIKYNKYMVLGLGLEIFTKAALKKAFDEADDPKHREHVTAYMYTHPNDFDCMSISPPKELEGQFRLTVDTEDDYELMKIIYERLYKPGKIIPAADAVALLREDPKLDIINSHIVQKSYRD